MTLQSLLNFVKLFPVNVKLRIQYVDSFGDSVGRTQMDGFYSTRKQPIRE